MAAYTLFSFGLAPQTGRPIASKRLSQSFLVSEKVVWFSLKRKVQKRISHHVPTCMPEVMRNSAGHGRSNMLGWWAFLCALDDASPGRRSRAYCLGNSEPCHKMQHALRKRQDSSDRLTWRASLQSHKAPAYQAVHIYTSLLITAVNFIQLCLVGSIYADVLWAVEALQGDLGGYLTLVSQQGYVASLCSQ